MAFHADLLLLMTSDVARRSFLTPTRSGSNLGVYSYNLGVYSFERLYMLYDFGIRVIIGSA